MTCTPCQRMAESLKAYNDPNVRPLQPLATTSTLPSTTSNWLVPVALLGLGAGAFVLAYFFSQVSK